MSESKETKPETQTGSTSALPATDSHIQLYSKFYTQACLIPKDVKEAPEEMKKRDQRILITLETITKLIFGSDGKKKARVVLYAGGALELIVALVKRSGVLNVKNIDNNGSDQAEMSKKIILSALKSIKTCVLRNPAGRARCRSSGALGMISNVFELCMMEQHATIVEEAFTTLAAMSLGDDLNALEASTEMKPFIKASKEVFPNASQMHQKTLYLDTLFAAIEKEQASFIKYLKSDNSMAAFFKNIIEAEKNKMTALHHVEDKKFSAALQHLNHSIKLVAPFLDKTKLLDDIVMDIRSNRASANSEVGNSKMCLEDTNILLNVDGIDKRELLKIHGKALIDLGRIEEGKETLAKLRIMSPDDNEVMDILNGLKL
mmetsp:Transcript_6790/g.9744  ORF Transcript_6790/g.9744 Transcript_6790/m.9744 type:complete len:375 (+) Transcript_6790:78-1202(+)